MECSLIIAKLLYSDCVIYKKILSPSCQLAHKSGLQKPNTPRAYSRGWGGGLKTRHPINYNGMLHLEVDGKNRIYVRRSKIF